MMRSLILAALAAGTATLGLGLANGSTPVVQRDFAAPPAEVTAPQGKQVAVFAGGCFWGMEGLFEHVKGVQSVTSGYAGGSAASANYAAVSSETTGHAEAIRITYDPAIVTYGKLLQVFFSVAHDPTQIEGQYPDEGHSYRSAIFAQTPAQRDVAQAYIASLDNAHVFERPIATRLENGNFYAAEEYHQHFMRNNPDHPYIQRWDIAKLKALRARYPDLYRG